MYLELFYGTETVIRTAETTFPPRNAEQIIVPLENVPRTAKIRAFTCLRCTKRNEPWSKTLSRHAPSRTSKHSAKQQSNTIERINFVSLCLFRISRIVFLCRNYTIFIFRSEKAFIGFVCWFWSHVNASRWLLLCSLNIYAFLIGCLQERS